MVILGFCLLQLINSVVLLVVLSFKENKPIAKVFQKPIKEQKTEGEDLEEASDENILEAFKTLQKNISEEIE